MSASFEIFPLKLRCLQVPQDDLLQALFAKLYSLQTASNNTQDTTFCLRDGDMLFLSAKVVSIHQGRCVRLDKTQPKARAELVRREADFYLTNTLTTAAPLETPLENPQENMKGSPLDFPFTLKGQTPVPFAGIDESNGNGWHILWPENLQQTADTLYQAITAEFGLTSFGLVIADSTVFPLRRGCIGVSIAAVGCKLLHNYKGQKDLFGQKLKLSENNIIDRLTSFATLFMGEGAEQTPAVVLRGLAEFVCNGENSGEDFASLVIDLENDFYFPLFQSSGFKDNG